MGFKSDQSLPSEREADYPPPPPYRPPLPPRNTNTSSQTAVGSIVNQGPHTSQCNPPPLPPQDTTNTYDVSAHPHGLHARPTTLSWVDQDPRNRSTESLVPEGRDDNKRILLMIYIHGFVGDETSFRSFPAHIHNLVTQLVQHTHDVHTKIYPRYKSRRKISFARDDFSNWLAPHESPITDVILIGHSMGGILSADVVLIPPISAGNREPFLHRILGTINFDTPFLGMHPGVIKSGLGSLFKPSSPVPKADPENFATNEGMVAAIYNENWDGQSSATSSFTASTHSLSTVWNDPTNDPNYNPSYSNDINIPKRKGKENLLHFLSKHSDDLTGAAKKYVTSHFEFGGAMADYKALYARYRSIRALESVDGRSRSEGSNSRVLRRVRFVNYYTASTGRIKRQSPSPSRGRPLESRPHGVEQSLESLHIADGDQGLRSRSRSPTPNPRVAPMAPADVEHSNTTNSLETEALALQSEQLTVVSMEASNTVQQSVERSTETAPTENSGYGTQESQQATIPSIFERAATQDLDLPPLPPVPPEPALFDPNRYQDEDIRKIAEKDHKRRLKAHMQALKDRDDAIKDRTKLIEKREKNRRKEQGKTLKQEQKRQIIEEKDSLRSQRTEVESLDAASSIAETSSHGVSVSSESIDEIQTADLDTEGQVRSLDATSKKKKDKKFCVLPSKSSDGQRDPTWVRVFMHGVDEVGAHMGLFYTENRHYEKLVNDVGQKVLEWVEEDIAAR